MAQADPGPRPPAPGLLDGAEVTSDLAAVEARMMALADGGVDDVLAPIAHEHLASGGKRLRARLALAAALALGQRGPGAIAWAAACELAHNATLIHDDLQDGDRLRRGRPTTWVRHGMAQAINAGDLLLMAPLQALAGATMLPAPQVVALVRALADGMVTVIRGQALECRMVARCEVDPELYASIIRQKTAALFELPALGAALLAGHSAAQARAQADAFAPLGMLFQMQDDVLDLFGDKGREAPGADLQEGKVSALVVAHCRRHPGERAALAALLSEPRATTGAHEVERTIQRFIAGGALADVLEQVAKLAEMAERQAMGPWAPLMRELVGRVLGPIAHLTAGR